MAKGNPFLGNISGSFGDITLKNVRGKTIITRRSTNPRNPRTPKQIYQRMFFATINKSKTALKNIVDHSFEQIPHGQDSLSYFVKRNIALMREKSTFDYEKQTWVNPGMNFVSPKATSFPANPLLVSEGSLSPLDSIPALTTNLPVGFQEDEDITAGCIMPFFVTPEGGIGYNAMYEYASVVEAEDIKPGDYVTAIMITAKKSDLAKGSYPCAFHFVRYKAIMAKGYTEVDEEDEQTVGRILSLIPSNVDGVNFEVPNEIDDIVGDTYPILQYNGRTDFERFGKWAPYVSFCSMSAFTLPDTINGQNINNPFKPVLTKADVILAGTWIHSRPDVDKILTSTQKLMMADPTGETYPFNLDLETAFKLWTAKAKAIGESVYLLEGGDI